MYAPTIQHQHASDLPGNTFEDQHPKSRNFASAGKTHAFRTKDLSEMKHCAIINKHILVRMRTMSPETNVTDDIFTQK